MPNVVNQLKAQGGMLFERGSLLSLWQEIANNFYPERADFVVERTLGAEFAADLMTSYPLIVRRDLANTFSAMLRPSNIDWFKHKARRMDKVDTEGKQWLQWFTKLQKNAMYDRVAGFSRATKECDNDFATFGQGVLQSRFWRPKDGSTPHLIHHCWHLRDVAWSENALGVIDTVYRKWTPHAIDIVRHFPKTVHKDVEKKAKEKPFDKHEIWHCVLPKDIYDSLDGTEKIAQPFVSIYFDPKHEVVLETVGAWVMEYTIPRWQTVSGSQYAHSPATIAALPDGRLIQMMTRVIYDSGEKAVSPPMIGRTGAIRSDIDVRANGYTAIDVEYDERLGKALEPLTRDIKGFNIGPELVKDIREQMKDAFFLNKLNLPPTAGGRDMTAYEVGQRVQEFIRNALPLFEPVETDYNGKLCEVDMMLILHNVPEIRRSIPDSLKGESGIGDFDFDFQSPLRDAVDKAKVGMFQEAGQIIAAAQAYDRSAAFILDGKKATREVLEAIGAVDWLHTEGDVDKSVANAQAQQKQQELMALMEKGASIAKDGAAASSDAASTMAQMGPV